MQRRELPDKEQVDIAEAFKVAIFFKKGSGTPSHTHTNSISAQNLPGNRQAEKVGTSLGARAITSEGKKKSKKRIVGP